MSEKINLKFNVDFNTQNLDWENIESSLAYVSKKIISYNTKPDEHLVLITCLAKDTKEVSSLVEDLLEKIKPASDEIKTHILFDQSNIGSEYYGDIFTELIESREIIQHSAGIYSLTGRPYQLFETLDKKLQQFGEKFSAQKTHYPITIELEPLNKINFFSAYPHFANFITTIKEEQKNISSFSQNAKLQKVVDFKQFLNPPKSMCRSAACLHSYPSFENQVLPNTWTKSITTMGRIFRNESTNVVSLERLNEFSMREFIFMGSAEYVQECLKEVLTWCQNLMKEYNLKGLIQGANDPFFADNLAALQFFQRSQQTKYEMRLINPFNNKSVSVASFNNHTTHFSKSYNIRFESEDYIHTGCVGFGLERLLFLLMAQFGLDESQWPNLMK